MFKEREEMKRKVIQVNGGYLLKAGDNINLSPQKHTLLLYQAMYNAYKNNIGHLTESHNEITEKMVENIKNRMLQLMGGSQ
tara:strand:- start:376 stop:618 length:243 start_codon:yes stop_codon:yes gene_type:complete